MKCSRSCSNITSIKQLFWINVFFQTTHYAIILTTWCFWARGRLAWWLWIFPVNNNSIFIWTSHLLGLPCIKIWSIMLLIILDPIVWIPCILRNQGSEYNMQNEISKALKKRKCSYEYLCIMNMFKVNCKIMFYRNCLQSKFRTASIYTYKYL